MTCLAMRFSARATLAGLVTLVVACTPPPPAVTVPAGTAEPFAQPTPQPAAATAPTLAAAAKPTAASVAVPTAPAPAATANRCKVAQVYASSTAEKGWSWAHAHSFLAAQKKLPTVDLSIRQDRVPTENKQAVADLIEHMVQQGAAVVYTTSPAFAESTRTVAARHPEVNFFNASGVPGPNEPPNVSYYIAAIEEARYITGEVAGLVVDPGANIGYVAAQPPSAEVFRGENAFALGIMTTNPTARVYNTWTPTPSDPDIEKEAARSLLEPPVKASLLTQHQDSPAAQLVAQDAGAFAIGYGVDMSDVAPRASLTSAMWDWTDYYTYTMQRSCPGGGWLLGGKANPPWDYRYWIGSFKDGMVQVAPLNMAALAAHPRKDEIQKLYEDEVAAFKAGRKSFESIFTGPIKDNEGQVRIAGKPDVGALYDERGQWFVENVVSSTKP